MRQMYTLEQLAVELERQAEAKVDYVADTRSIHFTSDAERGSVIDLLGEEGGTPSALDLGVNEIAHGQIAAHLKIPQAYYRRLATDLPVLLDENVNRLLRHQPSRRMIRTLDGTARAFLSDAYRAIDNAPIARAVLPILAEIPDCEVRSAAITDTSMHIKATTPRIRGTVRGQEVAAGVYIGNSEVGRGSFVVYPFVETLICTNGMVIAQAGEGMMRRIHLGRRVQADETGVVFRDETIAADDRALLLAVEDIVRAAVDDVRFRDLVAQMNRAADDAEVVDPVAAVQVLTRRESLTEGEGRDVLRHLALGGDLSRWGVISAVTRAAEDAGSYDRATELETLGGKLLDYNDRQWGPIARAEAEGALAAA